MGVIGMKADTAKKSVQSDQNRNISRKKIPPSELSLFCHETAIILKSGIALSEGMSILSREGTYRHLDNTICCIARDIDEGNSLYDLLSNSGVFPDYLLYMTKVGEVSGNLDIVMEYLAEYYDKVDKYNNRIRNAVTYPIILSGLMACVILLLITKVLPMFNDILESLGGEIPPATRLITNAGRIVAGSLPIILGAAALLFIVLPFYFKTDAGKIKLDEWKLKVPVLRRLYNRILAARISLGMSIMLKSGIDSKQAVSLVTGIADNSFAADNLKKVNAELAKGCDLAEAFSETGIFPALFIKMLSLGSKTGNIENTLKKAAEIYENEVDNILNKMAASVEPILVILLSVVIGIILLSVMIPLISIMSSIG